MPNEPDEVAEYVFTRLRELDMRFAEDRGRRLRARATAHLGLIVSTAIVMLVCLRVILVSHFSLVGGVALIRSLGTVTALAPVLFSLTVYVLSLLPAFGLMLVASPHRPHWLEDWRDRLLFLLTLILPTLILVPWVYVVLGLALGVILAAVSASHDWRLRHLVRRALDGNRRARRRIETTPATPQC